jgi:hypothetical protein
MSFISPWREATLGTVEEKKAKLSNPALRQAMQTAYDAGTPTRDFIFGELHRWRLGCYFRSW